MKTVRDRVIVSLAMRRSGHHAVLNQVCYQLGRVLHLNNCAKTWMSGIVPIKGRFRLYDGERVIDSGPQSLKQYRSTVGALEFVPNLMYSLEDADVAVNYAKAAEPHRCCTTICVIRDPFNWLASSLQQGGDMTMNMDRRIRLWKKQVLQCLEPESYPYGALVDVNYNKWVLDSGYRENLSRRLGLDFSDIGLDEVLKFGPGSSFDGTALDSRGSQMNVLERYKRFEHDPQYRSLIRDPELISLSERYFAFNPRLDI